MEPRNRAEWDEPTVQQIGFQSVFAAAIMLKLLLTPTTLDVPCGGAEVRPRRPFDHSTGIVAARRMHTLVGGELRPGIHDHKGRCELHNLNCRTKPVCQGKVKGITARNRRLGGIFRCMSIVDPSSPKYSEIALCHVVTRPPRRLSNPTPSTTPPATPARHRRTPTPSPTVRAMQLPRSALRRAITAPHG